LLHQIVATLIELHRLRGSKQNLGTALSTELRAIFAGICTEPRPPSIDKTDGRSKS